MCVALSILIMVLEEVVLISLSNFKVGIILEIQLEEPKQSMSAVTIQIEIFQ